MKKEKSGKKSLLWLWITIGVVVALVVAGVLCVALGVFDRSEKAEKFTSKIYWNMDGLALIDPATGLSNREAADDGLTYIRFAVGGEIVELPVADRKLVHKIDLRQYVCLKFDADGVIIDAVDVEEVYTKIAEKVFVQQLNGNTIQTNSSQALNGMPLAVVLNENTGIYNMTDKTEKPGYPGALEPMDQITVFGTDENTPTDVFIVDRYWYSEVYWRVSTQMYNSSAKLSTRKPAEDGYWYMDWTVNGEIVTLRTNRQDVINAWDGYSVNAACCGMVFDENGDVIDCFSGAYAARGVYAANGYDVTTLAEDGSSFTATRVMFGTEIGKTYTSVVDENTKIFNVNSTADVMGEPTELQMNDRLLVIADPMGKAKIIFVINRMVDSPLYYNVSRNYSSGLQRTQRVPDADGWYHIKLAALGKEVTYRTKDVKLVNQLDSYNLSLFGLRVENGIITKVYDAVCVTGNYSFAANNFVDSIDGVLLATSSVTGTAANGVLAANCEIYDVSGHGKFKGVATTIRVGDRVICYQNAVGEITHVYIINRHEEGSVLYWNVNRYYSGGKSTRDTQTFEGQPLKDEEGYYHFRVIKVGTTDVTWVKTKDVDIVNRMDSYGTPTAFSLYVNSAGVVTGAYPCNAAIGGYQAANYLHIDKIIEDDTGVKYGIRSYRTGATANISMADDVAVYDFTADSVLKGSPVPAGGTIKGSRTTLRIGDKVSCIAGRDGKVKIVFIIERETEGTYLALRKSGSAKPAEDGYYYFELIIDGKIVKVKTDDEATAKKITSYGYAFAVKLKGDLIVGVYHATASTDVYEMAGGAYYDVVKIEGGKVYLKRNRVGQSDTGKETTVDLASDYKAYMLDPTSGDRYGTVVKLKKGDRIFGYTNYDAKLAYIYVAYECTREGGNMGYCAHCGETVHWESVAAGYAPAKGYVPEVAHYYVPNSYASASSITFGHANQLDDEKKVEVTTEFVLDLNGKTWTRKGTVNADDGVAYASGGLVGVNNGNTLTITDYSKAGTGKMVVGTDVVYKSGGTGLAQSSSGATLIIEKGLFDASAAISQYNNANGGAIVAGGTLIVNGGTIKGFKETTSTNWGGTAIGSWGNTQIIINGGEIIGGKATNMGGTISANSNLTINGGKIYGGTAAIGDNIRFGNGDLVITGGEIDGGIHVSSAKSITLSGKPVIKAGANYGLKPGNVKMDVSGLKAGASVYVDASGVFTKDLASAADAQALITNGALKAGAEGMMLKVDGKAVASVSDGKLREWTDATKLPDMGNWKLAVDVKTTAMSTVSGELYIDLNGHNITREVAENALTSPQVFNVGGGNKLTIADSSGKPGTVSIKLPAADSAINTYSAVIHVPEKGEFVLEGGIIDGSNVDNTYVNANNGTISVGGKLTVNGGTIKGFKRGSSNGGAIGGWANTEITINSGKIYAGGSFLTDKGVQKVNGAAIATTGKLTINGGEIIGPGKTATDEQKSRSGGLIYVNGDSLEILGGKLCDGFGTGYGFNVYYERNYRGAADKDGNRPTVTGGGEVIIGGDAYINGGVTIRSSKEASPVKLTVKDTAIIDATDAVGATNVRLVNGELYLNADKTPVTTTKAAGIEAGKNYDISLVYTCKNAPKGFSVGNITKYEHTFGDDNICDDCGYDKFTVQQWTDATSLPTKEGHYKLATNVVVTDRYTATGDVTIDLNGFDITRNVAESALNNPQVYTVSGKLTILDSSDAADGTVSITVPEGKSINAFSAVIHAPEGNEFVLEGGIIDGSNLDNVYVNANNGTISVGGKLTVNGGVIKGFKRGSSNGGAIGGWAGSEIVVNGGKIYAGGSFVKDGKQLVNGAAIATTGKLTINDGEIIGPGKTATAEQKSRSGGLIYANGDSLEILGGKLYDGFGTGYGFNVYYERNYRGAADKDGNRPTITGGGEVIIGGDAYINGGITVRSSKSAEPAKLTVKDNAVIDATGAVGATNIRLYNGALYLNAQTTAATTAPADANYDISMVYTCKNAVKGWATGNTTKYEHTYGGDSICDECGHDLNAVQDWTDATKLPTSGNWKLTTPVTLNAVVDLTGDLYLDLNGYTVTSSVAPVIKTGTNKLTVDDTSGKTGDELGKIVVNAITGSYNAGVIHVGADGEFVLENGVIDGSNITTTYTAANAGTITIANGKINGVSVYGAATINGGKVLGMKSSGNGSAIGMMNLTSLTINGGEIVGNTVTKSINGTGYGGAIMAAGHLTITGGKISGGTATVGGDNIFVNNASAVVTISGGEIDGGVELNNFAATSKISGTVTIKEGANYGLKIKSGKVVDLTGLTGGEIYIDADGVFTTEFADATAAETVKALLKSGDATKSLAVDGKVIKMASPVEVSLSKTTLELTVGADETITATVDPTTATVAWTSSDDTVATVVDGKITAVKAGTATITATATLGTVTDTATCTVTVKAATPPVTPGAWTDWTDGTKLPTSGKYKLTVPVTFSTSQTLTGDLQLDLNGQTVTMTGASYAIGVNGHKLIIDDLSGKTGNELGCIKTTATAINARAAVIYVNAVEPNAGEFILNNGILDGSTAVNAQTGLVSGTVTLGNSTTAFSTFTMNGGIIKGQKSSVGTSGVGGSCVALMNSTHFVMNGGELIARTSTADTDYVCATGSCVMAGGASGSNPTSSITINGGILRASRTMNHGGVIYTGGNLTINGGTLYGAKTQNSSVICSSGPSLTVNGGMLIGGLTVANPGNGAIDKQGGTVTVGGNAIIGGGINIRSSAKLVFTGTPVVNTALGAEQKYDVRINGGSVHIDSATNAAISSTNGIYKVTYDANGKVNGLTAFAKVTYTESATLPTSGAVKLTDNVTLTEALVTTGDLYIDLNGKTVTNTGSTYAIKAAHNVYITDTSAEKNGTIKTTTASITSDAAVIYITAGKKLVLVEGILDGSAVTNGFATSYAGTVTVGNYASFVMLGGEVKGQISSSTGSTGKGGSCVGGWNNSNVVIYGGKLTAASKGTTFPTHAVAAQGTCVSSGGNVEVHGGELYGTMATNHGASIYSTGSITITGGLISGGYANNSGLVSCSGPSLTITGGTLVGGTAHSGSALGGASIDYAKNGGVLTIGGNAKIAGGVSIRSSAKLVLKDKAIIDMNMEGQTQKKFNIQIKNGTCSIYLNDTTGTALATASSGKWDVNYDVDGNITGITAK